MKGQGRKGKISREEQGEIKKKKTTTLSEQCKNMEDSNRMGKTRDVFKIIGNIKRTFHARMGTVKNRNYKDLTETEEIKKRWQEYTEELYKKGLNDPDNHDGVITQSQTSWSVKSSGP